MHYPIYSIWFYQNWFHEKISNIIRTRKIPWNWISNLDMKWDLQNKCGSSSTKFSNWWATSGKWTEYNLRQIVALRNTIFRARWQDWLMAAMSTALIPSLVSINSRISLGRAKIEAILIDEKDRWQKFLTFLRYKTISTYFSTFCFDRLSRVV